TTVIESNGSTSLVQGADNYFLYPIGGSSGPQLRFGGAAVEASGLHRLAQVADAYFLNPVGGSSGPQLRFSGAYVAAGGAWTPIGAEQVGSVYEVAWKNGTADQYLEWIVDGSGNYITQGSIVSGSTWWVQSFESGLHQDLNNDG